jgi:hypothetical protein
MNKTKPAIADFYFVLFVKLTQMDNRRLIGEWNNIIEIPDHQTIPHNEDTQIEEYILLFWKIVKKIKKYEK